jgi:hypothetical protein
LGLAVAAGAGDVGRIAGLAESVERCEDRRQVSAELGGPVRVRRPAGRAAGGVAGAEVVGIRAATGERAAALAIALPLPLALALTLPLALTLALTLTLPLALTLALTLPLALALALTLALTLPLALALGLAGLLALPLTLTRLSGLSGLTIALLTLALLALALLTLAVLPLLALALLAVLALLTLLALLTALALLAGVGEISVRLLESRRRGRQVAVDVDVLVGGLERLTQPVERLASRRIVATRQALDPVAQRLPRRARCLARLRLELRQLRREWRVN